MEHVEKSRLGVARGTGDGPILSSEGGTAKRLRLDFLSHPSLGAVGWCSSDTQSGDPPPLSHSIPMKAELYTLSYCPHCVAAVALLEERGIETVNHVMDTKSAELDEAKARFDHDTVPIVSIDGEFIGGNDALRELLKA